MRRLLPWLIATVIVFFGWNALDDYNVTWDEALGDFFFGQRYLFYFTSFDGRYLDFAADPYGPEHQPDLRSSLFRSRPWEYWPVANTLAALSSKLLSSELGLLDPFDGFHAVNLFLAAALSLLLYRFCAREFSEGVAAAAVLMLFLMPRVFADMVSNIKDFPEMVFFSAALILFYGAWERGSMAGVLGAGAMWGLALGTKANALFIAPVVVLYVAMRGVPESWRKRSVAVAAIVAAGAIACVVVFAAWPHLWADPVARLRDNLTYVSYRGRGGTASGALASPWAMLLYTTPPVVLLLFAAGLVPATKGVAARRPVWLFLTAWSAIVAGRLMIPGAINFDGVRHFLELFPPIVIVAASGAVALAKAISARLGAAERPLAIAAVVIPVALCASASYASHPFQTAYWNSFTGGLSGARERGIAQAGDYWAASYRLGLQWLNENAPQDSLLVVPIAEHTVRLVAPVRLRPDIQLVSYPRGGGAEGARQRIAAVRYLSTRRPTYVMYIIRPEWSTELDRDCEERLQPAEEWTLDAAPLLRIYRYTAP